MSDRVLGLGRMARRLGVKQSWLREEAQAGRLPSLPAGTTFLFDVVAVEEAIARRASECHTEDRHAG